MARTQRISPTKALVEEAFINRGTTLQAFIDRQQEAGRNVRETAEQIQAVTGVPVHWRTLYRWIEKVEKAS